MNGYSLRGLAVKKHICESLSNCLFRILLRLALLWMLLCWGELKPRTLEVQTFEVLTKDN